jgi:hypothetical protein
MNNFKKLCYNKWVADVGALISAYYENFVDKDKFDEFEDFLKDINDLYCDDDNF